MPAWFRRPLPAAGLSRRVQSLLVAGNLRTVCQEARCPNRGECFSRGTATFLLLGSVCTRRCGFCAMTSGQPALPDPEEPHAVARAVQSLGLDHVVLTAVTRDDLMDGGAGHFARTIGAVRWARPGTVIEILVSDFRGSPTALATLLEARPDILNHNMETVARLYVTVRPQADYRRSLGLLRAVHDADPRRPVKSGMMLGLGESPDEIETVLQDLRKAGCSVLTLGQYLRPRTNCLPVARYVPPEEYQHWEARAKALGFAAVASGPYVRSSYRARELFGGIGISSGPK